MRTLAIVIAASLSLLSHVTDAEACKCVPPPPVATAVEGATAVFAGKIVSVSREADQMKPIVAKFSVSKSWKGSVGQEVEVRTNSSSAACGLSFEEGAEWLVYADTKEEKLTASICSRSKTLDGAKEDLAELGSGTAPQGGSGTPPAPTTPATPATPPGDGTAPQSGEPPPVPPGASGCACTLTPEGSAPWGAIAALAAAGAVAMRRRGRRR
ncbi:MAG TPA: MYXO-CTERM sorting domain-containing protein [Bacilli bacterium]|nr:MYXO-CTERM sorting domain-containing protein [Bacilli bacterium]